MTERQTAEIDSIQTGYPIVRQDVALKCEQAKTRLHEILEERPWKFGFERAVG